MRERIFSMETEYAVSFVGQDEPTKDVLVDALRVALVEVAGLDTTQFLVNGSRFYHDVGHGEWSLPECRTAREVAVYDKAADNLLVSLLPQAEKRLHDGGHRGRLLVVKNNIDAHGHTYGCHENYMAQRETSALDSEDYLRLSIRYLVPFLTTRLILCGTGCIDGGVRRENRVSFEIGQRAPFINAVVSRDTRDVRGIFNLGRENEPFNDGGHRRMHLILGDACMSGIGTLLKLGTVGILLRMLEDLHIGPIPHLNDPVQALHTVSADPDCAALLDMQDGSRLTAIDIQRTYLQHARAYFQHFEASDEERLILQTWQDVLDALSAKDPNRLFGKVDWATKKMLMDRYLETAGLRWANLAPDSDARYRLQEIDIQYHNLRDGMFTRLLRGKPDLLVTPEEISVAQTTPPPYTRAYVRGTIIASARKTGARTEVKSWNDARLGTWRINMGDPLNFFAPDLYHLFTEGKLS